MIVAKTEWDFYEAVKESANRRLLHEVGRCLHEPPVGFEPIESYKTHDDFGNLQLTFSVNLITEELIVDADIDDADGITHIFQVLGHQITGSKTHPFDIHQILLEHQNLDTGYVLIV